MIINLRGNHAAGKSTAVRRVLSAYRQFGLARPLYGALGPRHPEAYECSVGVQPPLYILGPYESDVGTVGADLLTKKGVDVILELLARYAAQGSLLYEGIQLSVRFQAPTIGKWLLEHKDDVVVLVLNVTLDECLASLHDRQAASGRIGSAGGEKHIRANQRMFELVQEQMKEMGFRMEYVSREEAPERIVRLVLNDSAVLLRGATSNG